ncbi:MAG: amidohydrolase [Lachnospiraceae bacterium]|nr:amidohydrolase [Lachnospiraceae bacterium]
MISEALYEYIVSIRRTIHEHPEIGFDLPVTTALVKKELDAIGVPYTDKFAPSSVVAYFGNDPKRRTVAVRADMDALPIEEKTGVPFCSKIPGKMHACGHDTHTAILLGLAKLLKAEEEKLSVNVRLFFQPSEECDVSGAVKMIENGVMDGVDEILCTHCESSLQADEIGYAYGGYMAACMPFTIRFYGKTSHAAAAPEKGIDAIRMGYEAYGALEELVKKTFEGKRFIWNVGVFSGGTAHNVIADFCELKITFRYFDEETAAEFREEAIRLICGIAEKKGGRAEVRAEISSHAVYNDRALVDRFVSILRENTPFKLTEMPYRMSSEDFNWYLQKAPGFIFRFGIAPDDGTKASPAHSDTFTVNERGMKAALTAFETYLLNCR